MVFFINNIEVLAADMFSSQATEGYLYLTGFLRAGQILIFRRSGHAALLLASTYLEFVILIQVDTKHSHPFGNSLAYRLH